MLSIRPLAATIACLVLAGAVSALPADSHAGPFVTGQATRQHTRERTFDVHHVKLEVAFDPVAKSVTGRATTTLSPIVPGLKRVELDGVDLQVQRVTLSGGKALHYENTGRTIVTELDREYTPADTITFTIEYSAQPRLGLYFTAPDKAYPDRLRHIYSQGEAEENRHWFPCYDAPNDMSTSEIIATVPEEQTVVSNGELVSVDHDVEARAKTFHWRENVPHVTYLNSVIAGEFVELRDEWDGIPLSYYVPPGDAGKAERSFRKTPDMMAFYSTCIDYRYPYAKYAQTAVEDFRFGGMENAGATTLTRRTLHDERYRLDGDSDGLVAHELVHQWWGDLITTKNWNHLWLNEGFATYFDQLYIEHDRGHMEFMDRVLGSRESYLEEDSADYRRPIVTDYYEDPEQMFDSHSYSKGGQVLHMLRYVLGDDLFWRSIQQYARTYAGQNVITEDFRRAVENATGQPLEWFFEEWVYRGGHPDYALEWSWSEGNQAVKLRVRQTQPTDSVTPLFRMPIDVDMTGAFGKRRVRIELAEREQTFFLPAPSRPDFVEFDPEEWVLKTVEFVKPAREWLAQLTGAASTWSRRQAAKALGNFGGEPGVTEGLAQALESDADWPVRAEAAASLGKIRSESARDALLGALSERESRARRKVIEALGEFKGDEKVTAALKKQFDRDSSYCAQADVVKALAKSEAAGAFDFCVNALNVESYEEIVRAGALEALVETGDPRAVTHLVKWTEYGRPVPAREAAAGALGKLGLADWYKGDEALDRLTALLDDADSRLQRKAIEALGDYGDPDALVRLEQVVAATPDAWTKRLGREAITKIHDRASAENQISELQAEIDRLKAAGDELRSRLQELERRSDGSPGGESPGTDRP